MGGIQSQLSPSMLSNAITKSREVTLLRDANVDYLKYDNLAIKTFSIAMVFNKLLLSQQPTRITEYSKH